MDPTNPTNPTARRTVVGIFDESDQAQQAVDALHDVGFTDQQIGFIRRGGETAAGTTPIDTAEAHPSVGAGVGKGAAIGGILGAAAALLIPGVGPVIAGGVLVHTFGAAVVGGAVVGAAAGAVTGGLLSALTDMGVPEEEARYANEQFEAGRTIVTVDAATRFAEVEGILRRFGAHDIRADRAEASAAPTRPVAGTTTTAAPLATRATGPTTSGEVMRKEAMTERDPQDKEIRVPVTEEKLVPRKQAQEAGAVEIRKTVVEEMETIQVPVRREEVNVERVRTDRPLGPGEKPFTEETIRVPVHEEQVTVNKQARVVGEVVVDKERFQEQQPVSGTVRREEVQVERTGAGGMGQTRPWSEVMPMYQATWQQRAGTTGARWDTIEPAYRFGYESSSAAPYQGQTWDQAQVNLRRDWTARNPSTPWEKVKDSIQDAWDRAHSGT